MAASKNGLEGIWPGLASGVPKPLMPYSPAIKAGGWVFVAGTIASDFATGLAPEVKQANATLESELVVQGRYVLRNLANTIKACGVDPSKDMVRIWQWPVDAKQPPGDFAGGDNTTGVDMTPYLPVRKEFFGAQIPASSTLGVRELLCLGTKLEVEMLCFEDGGKNEVFGQDAGGGHATAVRRGDWVFVSAQNAADMPKREPAHWHESVVEAQTDHVLAKLEKAAKSAGSSLRRAVKAEVYIGHPRDFAAMDRVWRRWFPNNPPARVVIPYMGMGNPGNRVEVALTLLTDASKLKIETVTANDAPQPLGHEPQAVKAGHFLFFSTQMAFDSSGNLAAGMVRNPNFPWYGSPGQAQMRYIMKNVSAICQAAGTTVDRICRRLCLHSDFQWFAESIEEWARYFPEDKPASTTLRIGGPLVVPGANVLFDLTAFVP
jgi:enamine deaminase RidA (YjgF/YER057c/UK114 family)